jgi:hypothetical protein
VNLKTKRCGFPYSSIAEIRVFGQVLSDIRNIYRKWIRDRKGDHPPATTSVFQRVQPEVILGKLRVHRR